MGSLDKLKRLALTRPVEEIKVFNRAEYIVEKFQLRSTLVSLGRAFLRMQSYYLKGFLI